MSWDGEFSEEVDSVVVERERTPTGKAERIERERVGKPKDNGVERAREDGTDWSTMGRRMDAEMSPCRTNKVGQCSSLILSR